MTEFVPDKRTAKLQTLKRQFHDTATECRTAHRCGKTILATSAAAYILDMMERLVDALLDTDTQ